MWAASAASRAARRRAILPAATRPAPDGFVANVPNLGSIRTVIRHPIKASGMVLGHKLEVIFGHHTRRRNIPPKIPKHPMQDLDQNMNEVMTYADLKLRWQWTCRFSTSKMKIARHWKPVRCIFPAPKPTCAFIWHREMPHLSPAPEAPLPTRRGLPRLRTEDAFAIFKTSQIHQHKVTVGDLVQAERLRRREAGDKVVFGTVLMVGTKQFTVIGKPTVPYAWVKATVEQQTLAEEKIIFKYKRNKKQSKFYRRRMMVTMLRIDEIVIDPQAETTDEPPPKPVRLLDLWANRWLDPVEKEGIEMVEGPEGKVPKVAEIYDGSEHQPGTYMRRGITCCYRYMPDPQSTHWKL